MAASAARPLLAFGAHPDDIEFGCGAVLALEGAAGRPAHFVIGSRGEAATNGTPEERVAEAQAGATQLGADVEFVDLGGDAHIVPTIERTLQLAALIRQHRPQVVFAPTTVTQQHPDHVALGTMVRDAARLARYGGVDELRTWAPHAIEVLFTYAITPEAEPNDLPPVLIDVSASDVFLRWLRAMEAHGSQSRTRNYAELQTTRARQWGLRAGVEHAWPLWPADPLLFPSLQPLARSARRF